MAQTYARDNEALMLKEEGRGGRGMATVPAWKLLSGGRNDKES